MNTIYAFLNAAAVWFVLKAVEVVPFAVYDLFVLIRECFSRKEDSSSYPRLKHRFDRNRGRLEFVFSGAGFFRFSSCQRSKMLFLIASLVPILIFVLEIFSIFLSDERRVCQTSRDPNVVKAPALRIFGEGEREVDAVGLLNENAPNRPFIRPCLERHLKYLGVEYLASVCSDLVPLTLVLSILRDHVPENGRIFIMARKSTKAKNVIGLIMPVFSKPSNNSGNFTLMGSFHITSDTLVNGKVTLVNDAAISGYSINETITEQIRSDVEVLEKATNSTPSEFIEFPKTFMFAWTDVDDFISGVRLVILAIMSQTRRVGLQTAADMSVRNVVRELPEMDITCKEDFFLPRTVSIIIIVTGAVLRLLLIAIQTSLSSAEYGLLLSREGENLNPSID